MEQQLNNAFAFARGEGKAYWFLGSLLEMKATAEDTGGTFGMVELTHPPGFARWSYHSARRLWRRPCLRGW